KASSAAEDARIGRVCYIGGSITQQQAGWRPRIHEWLTNRFPSFGPLKLISAAMGNVGSKVLSFLVDDWVIRHEPDLIFVETVVNDGDTVSTIYEHHLAALCAHSHIKADMLESRPESYRLLVVDL
ncbi:hypothetical protein CYMTET_53139, partial [Cymbomonas tetramitiformis]